MEGLMKKIDVNNRPNLTSRGREVFAMLLTEKAPTEIARTLEISYNTVLYHQKKLYRKLGINSRTELFTRYSSVNANSIKF